LFYFNQNNNNLNYKLDGNFKTQINYQNTMGTKGELVKCYAELMQGLWNERGGSISPTKFKVLFVFFF